MVVRSFVVVESDLAHLLRDLLLLDGFVELVEGGLFFGGAQFAPLLGLGTLHAVDVGFGNDSDRLDAVEALFADVGSPFDRVTVGQGIIDHGHHLLQRYVVNRAPHPVVGDFDDELRVERMVREGTYVYIVVHLDRQRRCERFGGIFLAFVGEFFRAHAEISVQQRIQTVLPGRGQHPVVSCLDNCVQVGFQCCVELAEDRFLRAVVQTRIDLLGYDAVFLDAFDYVVGGTAFRKVQMSVQADVFNAFIEIHVADDPHFGQVHLRPAGPQNFVFQERKSRITPAGAAAVLVFDRSGRYGGQVGELVAFLLGLLCRFLGRCGAHHKCQACE